MAEGALDVVRQMGLRVPADLSFTGFGDPFWYRSWGPGITSVTMPVDKVVEVALGQLLDTPMGNAVPGSPKEIRLPSEVVLRGTTGKPPPHQSSHQKAPQHPRPRTPAVQRA